MSSLKDKIQILKQKYGAGSAGRKRPVVNVNAPPRPVKPAYAPPRPLKLANTGGIADMNAFLNQYRRFENIHVNLPKRLVYSSAHPGYQYVDTKGDGSCMYYSIYFAEHPDEDMSKPNQTQGKAMEIREIVAENATIQDVQAFSGDDLDYSIQREKDAAKKAELMDFKDQLEDIDAILLEDYGTEVEITEEMVPLLEEKLRIYRELLQLHTFWGQNREIEIFNRYVRNNPESGLKQIYVWVDPYRRYEGFLPGGVPIHFNGVGHYSILKPISGEEDKRAAENARAVAYDTEYRGSSRREQELRTAWKAKYGFEPRTTMGGGKRTRKQRALKKRSTRKH
jgi:hypothetical protein